MAATKSIRNTHDVTHFLKVLLADRVDAEDSIGTSEQDQGELLKLIPRRTTETYAYGLLVDSDVFFTGGAAQKSYLVGIFGDRPSGDAATGDSNDALLRVSGNNYAANDTNFIFRAVNASINNRSGGTLGRMESSFGTQNKSGGTCPYVIGLTITAENYGTCATEFGGVDIVLKNEGAVATTEYGVRVRNANNSLATKVDAAYTVTDTGANTGFTYGIDIGGTDTEVPTCTVSTILNGVPTRGANAYEYGFYLASDVFFTGGAATKSYLMGVFGDRPSGSAATGDSNDALLRISGNNYAANDANFIFRGLNASINNRSGGILGRIEHSFGSQGKSGGTVSNIIGLTITAENYGTVSDMFGGLDIILKNEAAVATTEYGIRIRNENNSIADAVAAAIKVTDTGANTGWDYILDTYGSSVVVAHIRLGITGSEDIVIAVGDFTDGADSGFAPGSVGLDTTNGLLFYCDSSGLWQQIAAA